MKTEDLIYAIDEKIQEGNNLTTDFFVAKGFLESADITHVVSSVGKIKWESWYDADGAESHSRENFLANHVHIEYTHEDEKKTISLQHIDSEQHLEPFKEELALALERITLKVEKEKNNTQKGEN